MSRAAEAEAMREEAGPKFARARVAAFAEAGAPEVFRAFFAMRVMGVAPIPGGEGFFFVGFGNFFRDARILIGFRFEQARESRDGEFAGVKGVVRGNLGVADFGVEGEGECECGEYDPRDFEVRKRVVRSRRARRPSPGRHAPYL
jgi:hypothetical protein